MLCKCLIARYCYCMHNCIRFCTYLDPRITDVEYSLDAYAILDRSGKCTLDY